MSLILAPAKSLADDDSDLAAKFDVGGKIGLNIATHGGAGASSQYVRAFRTLGFTLGGTAGVQLTNVLALQAEILFSEKGASYTMTGAPAGTYHLLYLEIPAVARIALPLPGSIEYHALLGPSLGILLDADIDLPDGEHVDLENSFERIDVGMTIGASVAVEIVSKGELTIDAKYNHGLLNIDKTAAPEDDDVMNRAFYFTVGYRTNLDTLLGGSSGASTSSPEPPEPAEAPTPAPPTNTQPTPELMPPPGDSPVPQPDGLLQGERGERTRTTSMTFFQPRH